MHEWHLATCCMYLNEPFCDLLGCDGDGPDHEVDGGPDGEGDVPEPEEDVDLLVDDVHGQDAEAVLVLDRAGGTVLVEGALGHLGEDGVHGVGAALGLSLGEVDDVHAVGLELVAEEEVDEEDLADHVDEVQDLAAKVPEIFEILSMNFFQICYPFFT